MPELAEVEYYRSQWDPGVGNQVTSVHFHGDKRVFLKTDLALVPALAGRRLQGSAASAKQMLFRFSGQLWLGVHLGMSGKLSVAADGYQPAKHDHLVLFQRKRALIFNDPRQFGRILVHRGPEAPEWWSKIGPAVTSREFTLGRMREFLARRSRLAIKAALLVQQGFPGIGNWMADEILWRAGIAPGRLCSSLQPSEEKSLWRQVRFVAREALKKIGVDFSDPPANWFYHQRWDKAGRCPTHKVPLRLATIGGRTTVWCPKCQR